MNCDYLFKKTENFKYKNFELLNQKISLAKENISLENLKTIVSEIEDKSHKSNKSTFNLFTTLI